MDIADGIITLSGVALGAAITLAADWMKSRNQRRQKYHAALFGLLDVYQALRRNDSGRMDAMVQQVIRGRFPEMLNDRQEYNRLRLALIQVVMGTMKEGASSVEELEKVFQASVLALAPVDPWMAYNLSGRVDSLRYIQRMKDLLESLTPNVSMTDEDMLVLETKAKSHLLEDILKAVEEDILEISKALGRNVLKKAQKKIATVKSDSDDKIVEQINGFIDSLVEESQLN